MKAKLMATTQSTDPHEKIDHPRHYNQHPSGIECIEIIEHLPCNLGNAVKYIWRCGLKRSSDPLRDLRSAEWYVRREIDRIKRLGIKHEPKTSADVVWRVFAERLIRHGRGCEYHDLAAFCLGDLLLDDLPALLDRLEREISRVRE